MLTRCIKNNSIYCSLLLATVLTVWSCAPVEIVATADDPDQLLATRSEITNYLDHYTIYPQDVKNAKVADHENSFYLLVRTVEDNENWVWIIPLKERGNKLKFKQLRELNACQTQQMDIEVFDIGKDRIHCKEVNHRIVGR